MNGDVIVLPIRDAEYWSRVAQDAHEWSMLMFRFSKDAKHARDEHKITWNQYFEYCDRFREAQQVFHAEYHLALTCRELADVDCSLADFVRALSSQHA